MFEHVSDELISVNRFFVRMVTFIGVATAMLTFGVVPGVLGFVWVEGLTPEQALVNALSLLGGIEPPFELASGDGYLFMAIYGLFIETVFFSGSGNVVGARCSPAIPSNALEGRLISCCSSP